MITATVLMTISCYNGFISERMIDDDGKNEHVAWSKRIIYGGWLACIHICRAANPRLCIV
jgi:hypothetical protein